MIDIKELRIGNLVLAKGIKNNLYETIIDSIDTNGVNFTIPDNYGESTTELIYDEVWPIEITEEWLIKLGLRDPNKMKVFNNGKRLDIERTLADSEEWDIYLNEDHYLCTVKYIHQLQNVFFDLGQELTIQ
jgi:hypothetical protein